MGAGAAKAVETGHQGGVDGQLNSSPQRQSIGTDLEAAVIVAVNDDIKRDAPGAQKSNTLAGSAVVPVLIKLGAAAAPGRVEGDQPKPKPSTIFAGPCPGEEALLGRIVYGQEAFAARRFCAKEVVNNWQI